MQVNVIHPKYLADQHLVAEDILNIAINERKIDG